MNQPAASASATYAVVGLALADHLTRKRARRKRIGVVGACPGTSSRSPPCPPADSSTCSWPTDQNPGPLPLRPFCCTTIRHCDALKANHDRSPIYFVLHPGSWRPQTGTRGCLAGYKNDGTLQMLLSRNPIVTSNRLALERYSSQRRIIIVLQALRPLRHRGRADRSTLQ